MLQELKESVGVLTGVPTVWVTTKREGFEGYPKESKLGELWDVVNKECFWRRTAEYTENQSLLHHIMRGLGSISHPARAFPSCKPLSGRTLALLLSYSSLSSSSLPFSSYL